MYNQPQQPQQQQIKIKAADDVLAGKYCNFMNIMHSKGEFVMDFTSLFPPNGTLNARIITSPGHMKRIVAAMRDNLKKYEEKFGAIEVAKVPNNEIGFNAKK